VAGIENNRTVSESTAKSIAIFFICWIVKFANLRKISVNLKYKRLKRVNNKQRVVILIFLI